MSARAAKASAVRSWLRFLPILVVAGLFVAFIASGAWRWLSLSDLAAHRDGLMRLVERHPVASLGLFLGAFTLVIVACVPGPSVMTIAGGFLFGPLIGGAAALTAALAGSIAVFLACRTAFGDWAARRAGATAARIEAGFSRDAFAYLLALRLMPVAPFFLVNLTAGLARIRLSTFIVATAIGSAPSSFIFAGLGSGLGRLFRHHEQVDARLLARLDIALPLTGLAVLSLSPIVWRLWRARRGQRG
jgi:uncharacterized membrane protein YdjX (TVP38/TMEM64 family)